MYANIIKNLYIGKSKLIFEANDCIIPDTSTIEEIFCPTKYEGNLPDYGIYGSLWHYKDTNTFEINWVNPDHKLFITGIPKGTALDNYRLKDTIWSSYYEDEYRGYLFQIIDSDLEAKLITDGSN